MWNMLRWKFSKTDYLAFFIVFLFSLAAVLVSVHRFWQYEVFYHDFGIFDKAIWAVSRLDPPVIDHLILGGKWIFADHFNPTIYLLSPLYLLTSRSEVILIAQSVIVGLSGLFIYLTGKEILKKSYLSLAILVCYFLFIGLQNAIISDFHEVTLMVLPLSLVYYSLVKEKKVPFFTFLLLLLGIKENSFLIGLGIAFSVFFLKRDWRKAAILAGAVSVLWGLLSIKVIIPYFSEGIYLYEPKVANDLKGLLFSFFDHEEKRKTIFYSFSSFGFLPVLNPGFWPLIIQDFVIRFLPGVSTRWLLSFHYSMPLAGILALSSLFSLAYIEKTKYAKLLPLVGTVLVLYSLFLYRFVFHGPLGLSYNPAFYANTKNLKFLDEMVSKVPKDASVMAQNNIATRFTHQKSWFLRKDYYLYKPDYILLDLRPGQNPNNFYGTGSFEDVDGIYQELLKDKNYNVHYKKGDQYIFKRV
jgi:uncharacterized membrane protein